MTDGSTRLTHLEAALIVAARQRWEEWRADPEWHAPPDTGDLYAEVRRIRCVREHGIENLHRKDKGWYRREVVTP